MWIKKITQRRWLLYTAKPIKNLISCLLIFSVSLISSNFLIAQSVPLASSVHANFGVDADIKSGIVSFDIAIPGVDTDDWFVGDDSGLGVIDVTDAFKIAQLTAGDNIGVEFRMSEPVYTVVNGDTWIDAVFIRDQHTTGGNKDINVFGASSDKNYHDPTTWTLKKGDVPQKNDIIDVYAHLRRDSDAVFPNNDDQWAFVGASTRSPNGTSYLDFEYFRAKVTYDAVNFKIVTGGLECGHTAYEFDAAGGIGSGAVITHGDVILSTNYTNGGSAADVRLYAWIDISDFPNGNADFALFNAMPFRPFDFGDENGNLEFHRCNNDNNIPYGYARISLRSDILGEAAIFAQVNASANVEAPTWGTIAPNGSVTPDYIMPTFAEFAINSTLLGFDTRTTTGDCQAPLGSVIVKTRSSDSFTAELKDMAGPFDLGDTPEYTVTIAKSGDLDCIITEVTLTATPVPPGTYKYEWYKNDAIILGTDPDSPTLIVTEPGLYKVMATVQIGGEDGCTAESTEIEVLQDNTPPAPPTTGGDERCGPGDVTLTASCTSGAITWYDAAVDGNVVDVGGDGSSYTVNIATTTSFWVTCSTADQNGCESERIEVTGVVYPLTPDDTASGEVCVGFTYNYEGTEYGPGTYDIPRVDANGCAWKTVLTVTEYPATPDDTASGEVCVGFTYNYEGTEYGPGTYDIPRVDANGCAWKTVLTVTEYPATPDDTASGEVCVGFTYNYEGTEYGPGTYDIPRVDANGCAWKTVLTVTEYPATPDDTASGEVCVGFTYNYEGTEYGPGTYDIPRVDANGCAWKTVLTVTEYPATPDDTASGEVCVGFTYNYEGTEYGPGTYDIPRVDANGCAWKTVLTVTEYPAIPDDTASGEVCVGFTYNYEGTEYGPGTYDIPRVDANGCAWKTVLTVTEYPATPDDTASGEVCVGFTYNYEGTEYGPGTYDIPRVDANGCAWKTVLTVTEYPATPDDTASGEVCVGFTYNYEGTEYGPGTYDIPRVDANGCAWKTVLTVTEYPATPDDTASGEVCVGFTYNYEGTEYGPGTYDIPRVDANGCAWKTVLTVTEYPATPDDTASGEVCVGFTYNYEGTEYGPGTYDIPRVDANGCAWKTVLTVTEYPVTNDYSDTQSVCDGGSYTWKIDTDGDGITETYTVSSETTETFNVFDANGCPYDLILTLNYILAIPCNITGDSDVCLESTHVYSAPAGDYNYSWFVTGATIVGPNDEQNVTVQPDAEGTFNVALTLTSKNDDCTNSCNMDVTVYDCCKDETAFAYNTAYDGINNLCFLEANDVNVLNEDRWGWTLDNLDLATDISDDLGYQYNSYTFNMYAGNGGGNEDDCDPTDGPGDLVGTVTISRDDDDIIITYDLLDPTDTYYYSLDALHVNLGCNQFPIKKKGRNWYNTTAPGQYNIKGNANGENMAVLTVSASEIGCLDDLYAIFHAEVNICRFEPTANSTIASIPTAPLTNEVKDKSLNVKAYPVPFKDKVTIEYNFDFETDVTIEVVDLRGRIFETITNKRYSKNTIDKVVIDMSRMQDQVFFVRISTNNGSIIKQIVSDNKK